jgi:hypothetical protein
MGIDHDTAELEQGFLKHAAQSRTRFVVVDSKRYYGGFDNPAGGDATFPARTSAIQGWITLDLDVKCLFYKVLTHARAFLRRPVGRGIQFHCEPTLPAGLIEMRFDAGEIHAAFA